MPPLPALLPAARGPVQGQVPHGAGERRQAGVAPNARDAHQLARLREAVSDSRQRTPVTVNVECNACLCSSSHFQ